MWLPSTSIVYEVAYTIAFCRSHHMWEDHEHSYFFRGESSNERALATR